MTTEEAFNDFLNNLEQLYDRSEAANIADWVFENVTGLKRLERRIHNKTGLDELARERLHRYLQELLLHKPVQYVLQEAWFYKLKFFVNQYVLIPRPETEELVSWVAEEMQNKNGSTPHLLDIGTGSGCIAISVKKTLKNMEVSAIDVSEEALLVATKNAADLETEIEFWKIDFLEESQWNRFSKYDVIVSNPPYIPKMEKEKLEKNVANFEPGIALFVQDNDPFIFYRKIAKFAQSHLKPGGKVFVEIHEDYFAETMEVFRGYNFLAVIREDMYGKKRMIRACLE